MQVFPSRPFMFHRMILLYVSPVDFANFFFISIFLFVFLLRFIFSCYIFSVSFFCICCLWEMVYVKCLECNCMPEINFVLFVNILN